MNDPKTGARKIVLHKLDGTTVQVEKLSPADFVSIANQIETDRRAKLVRNLDECSITGRDRLNALNEFDARPITYGNVLTYLSNDPKAYVDTILMAWKKVDPKIADDAITTLDIELDYEAGTYNPKFIRSIAMEIANLDDPTKKKSANPTTAAGSAAKSTDSNTSAATPR